MTDVDRSSVQSPIGARVATRSAESASIQNGNAAEGLRATTVSASPLLATRASTRTAAPALIQNGNTPTEFRNTAVASRPSRNND